MDPESALHRLIRSNILEESNDGQVRLSGEFTARLRSEMATVEALTEEELLERVTTETDSEQETAILSKFAVSDERSVGEYTALKELLSESTPESILELLPVVYQFRDEPPRTEGVPEAFIPVYGNTLEPLLSVVRLALVYVWRDDCQPCEQIVAEFNQLDDTTTSGLGLYSVYGPKWATLLQHEYDVVGGPTTLFVIDGEVDARLHGAHPSSVLRTEIETLRGQVSS